MKGIAKLGLVLAAFSAVACASLAVVYAVTEKTIQAQEQVAFEASLKDIFPSAETFEDRTSSLESTDPDIKLLSAILVKGGQGNLGMAVKASGPSYGGKAVLLVGLGLTRDIAGVRVLELNDTPGLGANAKNPGYFVDKVKKITFPGQFAGKFLTDAFEVKKDVAAITASTITSKSLTKIVKVAAEAAAVSLEKELLAPAADVAQAGADAKQTPAAEAATGGK
ncbi:MAG TPA: FMN-binding protein [Rectinemataceae bacterium]